MIASPLPRAAVKVPETVTKRIEQLGDQITSLGAQQAELADLVGVGSGPGLSRFEVFQGYIGVGVTAFVVTLLATPIVRRLAVSHGVIDRPSDPRKVHRLPIAYLGGVAVFLGLLAGITYSYLSRRFVGLVSFHPIGPANLDDGLFIHMVPPWLVFGITVIMLVGLIDDVKPGGIDARVKVGGQLFAAAMIAVSEIGTQVAQGVLSPTLGELIGNRELYFELTLGGIVIPIDVIYWTGTAIIAIFVLGACNASNLIDGLDGLLTGVTSISAIGLLVIALGLAVIDDGPMDVTRIVLCLALLGACLGFLPHNFNPATIFLGDCGSLLLGFVTIVIVLSLGSTGKTFLVLAGLIIYAIPIIDTVLAIVRRKLAGKRMSDPDSDHLHHMLTRALGVKGAVLTLYGIATGFAVLGVAISTTKARFVYALVLLCASYIVVYAIKIARKAHIEAQARAYDEGVDSSASPDDAASAQVATGES